ncbi:sugar ABC transporter ATP-binding protein [Cytobacillus horneckiae]|uniref:Sugar ABC transporter ATP-binding protein n=1 Tax=Cytobacillus horneckiae TaxID=549687 RepID=A0A2N0ZL86_9BACI|nr:sugar ABC transporter ATP-binding protein [Cytobacillus horneckiae]MEC1156199.1 sugar ABC transporter ATP-binding protein [Cytobacillus horneckiae]MED2938217.1 sugar ABC transporter ATP-binding protein [Cytobacillus horneckiae]PKG30258.1 sugar ABC transporter ATP-binding protein [Cytobacillus horneckiae]
MQTNPIVEMKQIHKSFYSVNVLRGVDFDLFSGEIHALMGENGAGKSTLVKILTGIHKSNQGEIFYKGNQTEFSSPKDAEKNGMAVIHQELNIIPYLTVAENMFLGKELKATPFGILKTKEMNQRTKEYLNRLGIDMDPQKPAGELSVGQQQMIEIARAIAANTEVLIMDEPTAALTDREIETLFKVMDQLRQEGVAIIYISHRMEEIFRMCNRITVLRDGQSIGTKNTNETNFEEIVKMMVGRELGERFPDRTADIGDTYFSVENLSLEGVFNNISFDVKKGEILGVAGLMGAGRTEIMEAIFGARKKSSGTIVLDGKELSIKKPHHAIKAGIGFITEDRKDEGLVLGLTVRENLSIPNLKTLSNQTIMSDNKEKQFSKDMIEKLRIKTSSSEQEVKSLSGGNQQKVVFGKWLGINPKLLILDEPTRGVDVGAKKEIYSIMNEETKKGKSIIMVSSELPEILGMSDRIMVIHEGKVTAILDKADANQEKIMEAATGGINR